MRVGSAFKTIESAQNAARVFRNYASVDPHTTDLLLAPDAFKYGRCVCEYYVNRSTEATTVPAITIITDILKKRNARHRAIAARGKGLGPEEVAKYAAEALVTLTEAQSRHRGDGDRSSPTRECANHGDGGEGGGAASAAGGTRKSAKRLRISQGMRSAERAAAAIATMASAGFNSRNPWNPTFDPTTDGVSGRRQTTARSTGGDSRGAAVDPSLPAAARPFTARTALDVEGALYPSLPGVDAPAVGHVLAYGDTAGLIASAQNLTVGQARSGGGGGGGDADGAWCERAPEGESMSFGVDVGTTFANVAPRAGSTPVPCIASMEPTSVELHASCMVGARGTNFCPSTTVFAVLQSDLIDGEQVRCS